MEKSHILNSINPFENTILNEIQSSRIKNQKLKTILRGKKKQRMQNKWHSQKDSITMNCDLVLARNCILYYVSIKNIMDFTSYIIWFIYPVFVCIRLHTIWLILALNWPHGSEHGKTCSAELYLRNKSGWPKSVNTNLVKSQKCQPGPLFTNTWIFFFPKKRKWNI